MKSLHLTTRIAADGMLHLAALEFADQEVEVTVRPVSRGRQPPPILIGQEALDKAREIGFIGSLDAEPNLSVRYKEALDWSHKT
jgi:hypothetical protein